MTDSVPTWHESRVALRPEARRALLGVLDPTLRRDRIQFAHGMLWTLFGDTAERTRDFLFVVESWRPFTAIVRSARPPRDALGVWEIAPRPFAPVLEPGRRLAFRLRAVASVWRPDARPEAKRGRREDVVMSAWARLPEAERTPERLEEVAERAARDWLDARALRAGFRVDHARAQVVEYDRARIPTRRGKPPITFGALVFEGELTVTDPAPFLAMLTSGLGAGRAFGNGLMQIAPARAEPGAGS